uniref:Uncharacterized protein n=1 Tax=Caenorhabditis japonica TaxID=281687 RepID=A0A8R1HRB3_CAEJA
MGDAGLVVEKTERERAMQNAKPGFWRQRQLETMNRIKKIIGEKRMDVEQKHMKIRKVLASEGAELRSKFADLHKRLVMKNNKMVAAASETEKPRKMEKETKPEAEKKEKTDEKLMLKAPESEKTELPAVNDSGSMYG